MAKYYVITTGEYSDYHVVHVTTNRKLAEAYIKVYDGDPDYLYMEEYDDLMDQCDIQYIIDKAYVLHPYARITVNKRGEINAPCFLKEKLMRKNVNEFNWKKKAPGRTWWFDDYNICENFVMWVQVDKYNYDFDKIVKVVMDTRAKMMAEREGL